MKHGGYPAGRDALKKPHKRVPTLWYSRRAAPFGERGTEDTACHPQSGMERTLSPGNPETKEMDIQSRLMGADSIQDHPPSGHSRHGTERAPGSCYKNHKAFKRHSQAWLDFPVSVQTPHQGASLGKVKPISYPTPATDSQSRHSHLEFGTRASHSCLHSQPKHEKKYLCVLVSVMPALVTVI